MTNNNNLYSEVMITESPFYYDANGRLRVRVLSEESVKKEDEEEVKVAPEPVPVPPAAEKEPEMRTADFQDRDLDGTDDRDQAPKMPKEGKKKGGLKGFFGRGIKRGIVPKKGGMRGGMERMPRVAPEAEQGSGRNINTRKGLRGVDAALARGAELKKRGREVLARTAELRGKLGVKRGEAGKARLGEPMSPEQKAEKKGMKAEFRALKGEKKAMKASGQKPSAEMKLKLRDMKSKLKSMPKGGKNNMRAMMKRGGSRLSMQESAPATNYLNEKMNLKTAKMGDVIKDFQESDAPQFKGKSKAKRRIMAIAAKLQAERG